MVIKVNFSCTYTFFFVPLRAKFIFRNKDMKKIIIYFAIYILASSSIFARTPQEAMEIARLFISQQQSMGAAQHVVAGYDIELAYTQFQANQTTPAIFVFNNNDDNGFVLVSAEDDARTILGYSDQGHFDKENVPENMQFWLQMYADELARYEANKPILQAGQASMGGKKHVASATYPTITPILGTVEWGQGTPFNNKCPQINGERAVTGCVATALSQIMYAHKYPTKGTGSHSYTSETEELTVSANFGNTTYDWANMIPNYSGSYTTTQANAIATLMHHVGVAADMDYTVDGSGAVSSIALAAITEYFGYNKAINVLPKDFMKEEDILQEVASDLQLGRPVYVSGSTVNQEGHAFVCDGMKSDGYLHINWGWNGVANGYFSLSALAPEVQGTGGSASNLAFTERVCIYSNIKPIAGGEAMPLVTIDKLTRTSGDAISKNTKVSFSLDAFTSTGIATAAGTVTYFIYNSNEELVEKVEIGNFGPLDPGYYYTSAISISHTLPSTLANGDYELEIRYIDDDYIDHPILVKGLGEVRVPFTVTSSQFVFSQTPEPGKELRNFTNADFSLISGSKTWAVDLFSSQFWADTPSENDVLIRCNIHSNSATSVVGTYTMEAGTIETNALYAEGYYQACYQYVPTALHLTIIPAEGDKVTVQYYMEVNGKVMQGSYTTTPDWYEKDGDTYYYNTDYNYDLATTLPASKALQLTKALSHTDMTTMSYFVDGTISNMRNTATQIAQYKTARFDISDNGTTNNQFYCYNTKWLGNTDFTTGNEIKLGDKVVVLGQLQNYSGNTPEIKGYVYQHTVGKQPEVDYSIKNLQVTTNQDTVFFNFESEAPYFHVKITKDDGTKAAEGIIDFKNVYIILEDGNYTLWIRPVDEAQEYYIGDAVETTFTIQITSDIDYSIRNLQVTTEGSTVYFSWESDAPYFHVKITNATGEIQAEDVIDFKTASLKNLADDIYTLWIRPVDEAQEYYIGEAVEVQFEISTKTTGIEDLDAQQAVVLYDLMGRLVDSKQSSDNRPFDVPANGVYIQCTNDKTTKIYINKQ